MPQDRQLEAPPRSPWSTPAPTTTTLGNLRKVSPSVFPAGATGRCSFMLTGAMPSVMRRCGSGWLRARLLQQGFLTLRVRSGNIVAAERKIQSAGTDSDSPETADSDRL